MKRLLISALMTGCLATSAAATTVADNFSDFFIFGDSLSDNGNLFIVTGNPPAPYAGGRFSNGLVWNEAIGAEFPGGVTNPALGAPVGNAANLAFGGARADNDPNSNGPIPSFEAQIGIFLGAGGTFGADSLVSVWAGANDIFQGLNAMETGTDIGTNTAADMSANLLGLVGLGAKNLLVFNLPDMGTTPRFAGGAQQSEATDATLAYNAALDMTLDALELANPDVDVFRVDMFTLFNQAIADPAVFGFSNVLEPCIAVTSCVLGDQATQASFLFWDDVHPTTAGHGFIEQAARDAVIPATVVPLPAGAPLLAVGLVLLGGLARRRA